jgi:hypothetical protein
MDHTTERSEKVVSELTGQFSEMLRQWLQKIADKETVTLGELEADVRRGLHSLGEEVLQGLVDVVGSGKTSAPVLCPQCRAPMAFVRYQGKWVQTLLGTIRPERAYFHCAQCRRGHVPLDHQLGLGADSLSGGLEEALCLLAAHMPLEVVVDTLQRLLMVQIDDNTVQRTALRVGSVLVAEQGQCARTDKQPSSLHDQERSLYYI